MATALRAKQPDRFRRVAVVGEALRAVSHLLPAPLRRIVGVLETAQRLSAAFQGGGGAPRAPTAQPTARSRRAGETEARRQEAEDRRARKVHRATQQPSPGPRAPTSAQRRTGEREARRQEAEDRRARKVHEWTEGRPAALAADPLASNAAPEDRDFLAQVGDEASASSGASGKKGKPRAPLMGKAGLAGDVASQGAARLPDKDAADWLAEINAGKEDAEPAPGGRAPTPSPSPRAPAAAPVRTPAQWPEEEEAEAVESPLRAPAAGDKTRAPDARKWDGPGREGGSRTGLESPGERQGDGAGGPGLTPEQRQTWDDVVGKLGDAADKLQKVVEKIGEAKGGAAGGRDAGQAARSAASAAPGGNKIESAATAGMGHLQQLFTLFELLGA